MKYKRQYGDSELSEVLEMKLAFHVLHHGPQRHKTRDGLQRE